MWDAHSLLADQHKYTLDHPDTYAFVDVSQNNHHVGFEHWQNPQAVRDYVIESGRIRPLNSVKIYGANTGSYGTNRDAQERFWRNILNYRMSGIKIRIRVCLLLKLGLGAP